MGSLPVWACILVISGHECKVVFKWGEGGAEVSLDCDRAGSASAGRAGVGQALHFQ